MGNLVTKAPSRKMAVLAQEMTDISANISSKVTMEAIQNIAVAQNQNILITDSELQGCDLSFQQQARVTAAQQASFRAVLSNPREIVKKLTQGPDSIMGQAFASNSKVMKEFLTTARRTMDAPTDADLRLKMATIVKTNISQQVVMRVVQNIALLQNQNVLFRNVSCKPSPDGTKTTISVVQSAVVDAFQNAMFTLLADSLSTDPGFRRAVREFNGEYSENALQEENDSPVFIPPSCMCPQLDKSRPQCPPCQDCPDCGQLQFPECSDLVLRANLLYAVLFIIVGLSLLLILRKK
jgi:hypothetical protein